jgi:hypothetical protein
LSPITAPIGTPYSASAGSPKALAALTPEPEQKRPLPSETTTRNLADLTALLERQSPLGLCLRRSLVRFHYLRQLDMPLVVQFGVKRVSGAPQKESAGHAWLTLHGRPYYEAEENWRDFAVMFTWPGENRESPNG